MASTRMHALASRTTARSTLASPRRSLPAVHRTYASSQDITGATTQGTPGATTNIYNPTSSSPESQDVNTQRGKESIPLDSVSSKSPSEESIRVKSQNVEKEGQKPLDPADTGGVDGIRSGGSTDGR